MIKISIIVPVYNIEKYVEKCLNSVKNQTYENWELLVIDDGSTDGSGKICDEIAKDDSRIHIIHQKNGGVSNARNTGLLHADGDYIMFLDGDDMLCINALEELVSLIQRFGCDLISFGLRSVDEKSYTFATEPVNDYYAKEMLSDDLIGKKLNDKIIPSVSSLYKAAIILGDEGLRFDEGLAFCEDALFYFQCVLRAKKTVYSDAKWYIYVQHADSSVHSELPYRKTKTDIEGWIKIKNILSDADSGSNINGANRRLEEVKYVHFRCDIDNYCRNYNFLSEEDRRDIIRFIRSNLSFNNLKRDVKCWIKAVLFVISPGIFRNIYMKRIR